MENIYTMIDEEKRKIERENFVLAEEQASDDLTFFFSTQPKMTIIKKEMSNFLENFRR